MFLPTAKVEVLIIEIKKTSNSISREWDIEKLKRFTSKELGNCYEYSYGAFIEFGVGPNTFYTVDWFRMDLFY
jgi:hypothetical protein